jgi:hypothetical protein
VRSRDARTTQSWCRSLEGEAGGCAYRVDIAAYTLGALDRREEAKVTAHLPPCWRCQVALESIERIPGLLAWTHPDRVTPAAASQEERVLSIAHQAVALRQSVIALHAYRVARTR